MRTSARIETAPTASAIMLHGLRGIRKRAGLSQREAAAALNVSRQSYCYWETLRTMPSARNIIAILALFDCKLDELYQEAKDGQAAE